MPDYSHPLNFGLSLVQSVDLEGYVAGPVPPGPVPLWLGSRRPRMFGLTGRRSGGWVSLLSTYMPPQNVPAAQQKIDEGARATGRAQSDVGRIHNVVGAVSQRHAGPGPTGGVDISIDTLTQWCLDLGFDTLLWPTAAARRQLATFTTVVAPAIRERVAARRATGV